MSKKKIGVALVGCGSIGLKRVINFPKIFGLIGCFDVDNVKSLIFAKKFNTKQYLNYDSLLSSNEIKIIIIATPHKFLKEFAEKAIRHNKHVFIEKPGSISVKDISSLIKQSQKYKSIVRVGYNHRFHRSVLKAYELFKSDKIGKIMFLRARYGHGGRLGYEKEWRANKKISGGGELIDQGSHLIDLSMLFLGNLDLQNAVLKNYFWKMSVEDNAFITLKNKKGNIAFLNASCTEWKNIFSFEIYGKKGKIHLEGLGGSYGIEKISLYKMKKDMRPPTTLNWEYPTLDNSWKIEMSEYANTILSKKNKLNLNSDLHSSKRVLELIERIYQQK